MLHDNEKWIIWKPFESISDKHYAYDLMFTKEGLSFRFGCVGIDEVLKFNFDTNIEFFSFTQEGTRLETFVYLKQNYGKNFLKENDFFEVLNSNLIKKIFEEQGGAVSWEPKELKHYVIMNDDGIFDILAYCKPTPIATKINVTLTIVTPIVKTKI